MPESKIAQPNRLRIEIKIIGPQGSGKTTLWKAIHPLMALLNVMHHWDIKLLPHDGDSSADSETFVYTAESRAK